MDKITYYSGEIIETIVGKKPRFEATNTADTKAIDEKTIEIEARYGIAIEPTTVYFANEHISCSFDTLGHIEFFDEDNNSLAVFDLPVSDDPSDYGKSAKYGEVRCAADGEKVTITLPKYSFSDNYPYCDGEYDRWDRKVIGWFSIVFDCKSKSACVAKE